MEGNRQVPSCGVNCGSQDHERSSLKSSSVQVHLRLTARDAELLKRCAERRDQTISGFVRSLVRVYSANFVTR